MGFEELGLGLCHEKTATLSGILTNIRTGWEMRFGTGWKVGSIPIPLHDPPSIHTGYKNKGYDHQRKL